jgi:NADPH-dependent curcumin reductase CurA
VQRDLSGWWVSSLRRRYPRYVADEQIATQIALAHPKCKVVAIAGSVDKCTKLKEMGCHTVLNYKDKGWQKKLKEVGLVDVYFDNGQPVQRPLFDVRY